MEKNEPTSYDLDSSDLEIVETTPTELVQKESEESTGEKSLKERVEIRAAEQDEPGTDLSHRMDQLSDTMSSGFTDLSRALESHYALTRHKEEQIARLHEELQAYKNEHLERVKLPLIHGIIRLHDDLGKVVASLRARSPEELTSKRFFNALEGFGEDLELLLGQHGVEPFQVPGESFDPQRQTALRNEPATTAEAVGLVADRLRPGFEREDRVLQKERVVVYAGPRQEEAPTATLSKGENS